MKDNALGAEEWLEAQEWCRFDTEQACADTLFSAKWPDGFRCARCQHGHAYKINSRRLPLMECRACHYQESLTAGTVMEGSRSDLRKWFRAILLVSLHPGGVNAVQLQAAIGVTYKTAWLMLRKIRHAMSQADSARMLSGMVQVNSAIYGRPHNPTVQRHPKEQPLLVGASVNEEGEPVYIKIKQVPQVHLLGRSVRPAGIRSFIERQIEPDSVEEVQFVTARFSSRRFIRLLKAAKEASGWMNRMFHGIGPKYLQTYLDEFCCRFNAINQGGDFFNQLIHLCAATAAVTSRTEQDHWSNCCS